MNTAECIAGALALALLTFPLLISMVALSRAARRRQKEWDDAWRNDND